MANVLIERWGEDESLPFIGCLLLSLSSTDSEYLVVEIESRDEIENQGSVGDGSITEPSHRAISNLF